jgi:hypothetical protein
MAAAVASVTVASSFSTAAECGYGVELSGLVLQRNYLLLFSFKTNLVLTLDTPTVTIVVLSLVKSP